MNNNDYYQTNIKTSRQEDGIYAMRYASQQIIIDKLKQKLEAYENMRKEAIKLIEDNWITYEDSKQFTEFDESLFVFIKEINHLLNILNKVGEDNR